MVKVCWYLDFGWVFYCVWYKWNKIVGSIYEILCWIGWYSDYYFVLSVEWGCWVGYVVGFGVLYMKVFWSGIFKCDLVLVFW